MSRYIDADVLIDKLMNAIECGRRVDMPTQELEAVLSDVRNAPSIDIVRCKECKNANTEDCSHSYWDDDWGEWRVGYKGDDWFCADGEREGE